MYMCVRVLYVQIIQKFKNCKKKVGRNYRFCAVIDGHDLKWKTWQRLINGSKILFAVLVLRIFIVLKVWLCSMLLQTFFTSNDDKC